MTDTEVIALLNHDVEMEHQAILLYLLTAWTIEDLESPILEVARDEMKHMKWFAHAVVALGGEPSMKVPEVPFLRDPIAALKQNAEMEDDAAATYQSQLDQIPEEYANVRRLLERIKGDELYHEGEFVHLVEKVERMQAAGTLKITDLETSPDERKRLLWRYLQEDVSGEYAAILRYLHQSFMVEDGKLGDALEDRAIDEMKHMAWMAEEIVETGGEVDMKPDPVTFPTDLQGMFTGNAKLERAAEDRYQRHIDGYDDEDLRRVWKHIKFQEEHHTEEFEDRLDKLASNSAPAESEESEKPDEIVQPQTSEGAVEAEGESAQAESMSRGDDSDKKPTVGSLYHKKSK